jgi:hypothetical protein
MKFKEGDLVAFTDRTWSNVVLLVSGERNLKGQVRVLYPAYTPSIHTWEDPSRLRAANDAERAQWVAERMSK